MTLTFDGTIVVPVADPDDGERTARALTAHLEPSTTVLLLHVIEKGAGALDTASPEQRELYAADVFERATSVLDAADSTVETTVGYGPDVVETVFRTAEEADADAVVFLAREGNRFVEILTGDVARRLVKEASVPVVALP